FPGGFSDFASSLVPKDEPKEPPRKTAPPPKEDVVGKNRHEALKQVSRDREKQKRRVKELEDLIAAGEKQLTEMRERLREDPGGDWAKLAKLAAEEQAVAKKVEQMMAEWERLSAE